MTSPCAPVAGSGKRRLTTRYSGPGARGMALGAEDILAHSFPKQGEPVIDHSLRNLTQWLRALAVVASLASLPSVSRADSILTCSFTDGASLTFQETGEYFPQRKPFEAQLTTERFDIVFAGLDTDTPVAKGNLGE